MARRRTSINGTLVYLRLAAAGGLGLASLGGLAALLNLFLIYTTARRAEYELVDAIPADGVPADACPPTPSRRPAPEPMTVHTPIETRSRTIPPWAIGITVLIFLVGGVYLAGNLSGENPPIGGVPSPSGSGGGGLERAGDHRRGGLPGLPRPGPGRAASGPTCTAWRTVRPARTCRTCTPSIPMTGPTSGSPAPIRRSRISMRGGMPAFGGEPYDLAGGDRDHRRVPEDPAMTDPAARPVREVPVLIGGTEMAEIDDAAQRLGLSQDALMESAGAAVTEVALAELAALAEPVARSRRRARPRRR